MDGFFVAEFRIGELALVDVLPDGFVAVLVAPLPRCEFAAADENTLLKSAERLHFLDRCRHALRPDIALAAGTAELQRDAQAVRGALLRPIGRAFGEVDDFARSEPLVLAV